MSRAAAPPQARRFIGTGCPSLWTGRRPAEAGCQDRQTRQMRLAADPLARLAGAQGQRVTGGGRGLEVLIVGGTACGSDLVPKIQLIP